MPVLSETQVAAVCIRIEGLRVKVEIDVYCSCLIKYTRGQHSFIYVFA